MSATRPDRALGNDVSSRHREVSDASQVTIVMITRNRPLEARRTVERLLTLGEGAPLIVIDNGSTADAVGVLRTLQRDVTFVPLGRNAGAAGRNIGVRLAATPYVAFVDDDSTWLPGALPLAARLLDRHARLALVAAHIVVGDERVSDPVSLEMAASEVAGDPSLPGRPVLGFVACAAVVRREAFLEVGGFDERYGVGGEERPLAVALAAAGWALAYVPECVVQHWPSPIRDPHRRRRVVTRNDLWSWWRQRRLASAVRLTGRVLLDARHDDAVRLGTRDAILGALPVLRARRPIGRSLERALARLERSRPVDPEVGPARAAPARAGGRRGDRPYQID
jgi:N-acetylglucosaminyl-diphospho-decaprenol L-rhamnosyltransferase